METNIKKIEDMSLNAWPSHKMELYDAGSCVFLFLYAQDQQRGAVRRIFPALAGKKSPTARMNTVVSVPLLSSK